MGYSIRPKVFFIYWRKYLLLLLTIFTVSSFAQTNLDTALLIKKIFLRYLPQNPGCQFSVSKNDSIVFSKAWGMADMENNIPLTLTSIIEAGSISKQFTAAAILLMEQQGKLSLDDDVRKYVPELPSYGTVIKLKHLLHHTSGIKDWGSVAGLTGWERGTKTYRNEDALEIIAQQKTLNNIPGAEFIYSNSNYNLQAIIVQRVSGMSLADYTQKYIFNPAGMIHTQWRDNFKRIVHNRAIAYQKTDTAYETNMPNEYVYGNGGLLTTTEDLLKWNNWYLSGKFGSPSLLQKQITVDTFNNGVINYYGAGLFIQTSNGMNVIRHSGATASYRSYLENYPELNLSMAWLSNTSQFDTSAYNVIREVEKIFIKKTASVPTGFKKYDTINVSLEKLKTYEGWYRNDRNGNGMQLHLKDKNLVIDNKISLIPINDGLFKMDDDFILFNKSKGFKFINADKDTTNYSAVLPANLSAKNFNEYTGKYFSDETKSGITIAQQGDTLLMVINSYSFYPLKPIYKDGFKLVDFGGSIYFERDKKNNINKIKISISRARNVEFAKIK